MRTFVDEDAPLCNEDHAHLRGADIRFLWAASGFPKQGRYVLGQCEEVMFRCSAWQRERQEQQMHGWFGHVPDFLITLAADHCRECSDAEFCALVEHELYHIGHAKDEYGVPKFTRDGMPKLAMRAHDVEEFIGVVRRYGATKDVETLLQAAKQAPEVAKIDIARACGTCLLKSA
ncbi:putative metallopeptidase [Dyella kyungheensis]|uniref:putative metallopeptidase n=1 Tax=Dyella kyungheensis TaxID=1242174 RepID=UPI003CFB7B3A